MNFIGSCIPFLILGASTAEAQRAPRLLPTAVVTNAVINGVTFPRQRIAIRFTNLESSVVRCSSIVLNVAYHDRDPSISVPVGFAPLYFQNVIFQPAELMAAGDRSAEVRNFIGGLVPNYQIGKVELDAANTRCTADAAPCPEGFVSVPRDPTPGLGSALNETGVPGFCIAKYEMTHPDDEGGEARGARNELAQPLSKAGHRPWTNIARGEAIAACRRMTSPGFVFDLISNGEWQAVARNIENTRANWSGRTVGAGFIPRGHSDGDPMGTLAASSSDSEWGTAGSTSWVRKRTHVLSNDSVVWDLAGNALEWIQEDRNVIGVDWSQTPVTGSYWDGELSVLTGRSKLLFGPLGNFGTREFMGHIWVSNQVNDTAILRGGLWGGNANAGIFDTYVGVSPSELSSDTGFRCVARPQE